MANDYDSYIPERDYKAINYEPLGVPLEDLCGHCKDYYKMLFDRGLTKEVFPPTCEGHITDPIKLLKEEDFQSKIEYDTARISLDPISWAMAEFGWEARWTQEQFMSCTSKFKVARMGRRTGKSEGHCVSLLHHATTNSDHALLVLAPYEAQVSLIFQILRRLVNQGISIRNSVARNTLNPHRIEFHNGSYILGFSAGSKTAARTDKIRGQDAHVIYIDEFDYIPDSDIAAVTAILISHPDCKLWTTSTPTGLHKRFFAITTDKDLGYKEFWYTSMEIPHWNEQLEKDMRREYNSMHEDSPEWDHEILAEFGQQVQGVFRNSVIDTSLQDYDLGSEGPNSESVYILGVDWNKTAGTHMLVVKFASNQFTIIDKIIIPRGDFTQTMAVDKIIKLHEHWNFKGLYVDRGYGSTQVELLKRHGLKHPSSNLHLRLRSFAMQEMTEIRDPVNGSIIKKHTKPFLVEQLVEVLNQGRLVMPMSEDTRIFREEMQMGVVQQMRNYKVEGYSIHGLPKYSQGQDHTLTALMLAVGGYCLEHTNLTRVSFANGISLAPGFGQTEVSNLDEVIQASDILKNIRSDGARALNKGGLMFTNDASSIRDQYNARKTLNKSLRSSDKAFINHMTRMNLGGVSRKNV